MFIAVNKIPVPPAHQQAMLEAFEKAAPGMKQFSGFLGLEMWTDENNVLFAVSRWETKADLEEYTKNPLFKQHHGNTPTDQESQQGLVTYYSGKTII